jgi:hypothetical protein
VNGEACVAAPLGRFCAAPSTSPYHARLLGIILLLTVTASCSTPPSRVSMQADYWRQKLARDLHPGMAKEEILAWANDNHLKLIPGQANGELIAGAGYVPEPSHSGASHSAVCKGFGISISLELDASDRLVRDEVRTLGNCL